MTLPRAPESLDTQGTGVDRDSLSILCIDDDAESRRILAAVLSRIRGANVHCAAAAVDGIAYLEHTRPDLMVLDRHLPDMAGDELLRHIGRLAPGCPVVLISSDANILEPGFASPPIVAALAKPLDLVQFAQKCDQCFVVVGARTQLEEQVRIAAIRFVGQGASQRQPLPVEPVGQHGRMATRRPGGPHRRQQGEPAFVLED